jgi:hypothetical protein
MTAVQETAWYVYAILPAGSAAPPDGEGVLPEARLEVIDAAGLAALASLVPRALFAAADPACRAGEPDWVAARAAAHHAVVALAAAGGPCLPLGFGTLFSTTAGIAGWLDAHAPALLRALAQVSGRQEWAVTIVEDAAGHADWLRAHDAGLLARAAALATAARGAAFLLARQMDKAVAAAREARAAKVSATVQARLASLGELRVDLPPGPARLAWSLLAAPEAQVEAIVADIGVALQGTGLTLRVTGPWPPYAFARAAWQENFDA